MPRMFPSDSDCRGATVGKTGHSFDSDQHGFVHPTDPRDVKELQSFGYVVAGNTPARARSWWTCECGWEAWFNHCPRCDRDDLTKTTR